MTFTRSTAARVLSIILMFVGWAAASNRCALASVLSPEARLAAVHQCCSAPAEERGGPAPEKRSCECCEGLGALPLEAAAKWVKAPDVAVLFELSWSCLPASEVPAQGEQIASANGPPEARSFAEVVLRHSLRSHAPPSVG